MSVSPAVLTDESGDIALMIECEQHGPAQLAVTDSGILISNGGPVRTITLECIYCVQDYMLETPEENQRIESQHAPIPEPW